VHENTVGTITEGDTTVHGTGTATPMIKTESDVGELYSPEPSKSPEGWLVNPILHRLRNPGLQGNPLVEALGPNMSKDQATLTLASLPRYDEEMRGWPDEDRILEIESAFQDLFMPLSTHLSIFRSVSCLLRIGYQQRNPRLPGFQRLVDERLATLESTMRKGAALSVARAGDVAALGYGIFGDTGIGKTRTVRRIMACFEQVIIHNYYRGEPLPDPIQQLTWLWVQCPRDASLRMVCEPFFKAVDDVLKTKYQDRYLRGRPTIETLLMGMATIATRHYLGALILDNLEHIDRAKAGGVDALMAFLLNLADILGIPIIIVGTPAARALLQEKLTTGRRFMSQGDLFWRRMAANDPDWNLLLKFMWTYRYTRNPDSPLPSAEVKAAMHEVSQGLTGIAIIAYKQAQRRAIELGVEQVTPAIIRAVSDDSFNLPRNALNALRSGSDVELRKWPDLFLPIERPGNGQEKQGKGQVDDAARPAPPVTAGAAATTPPTSSTAGATTNAATTGADDGGRTPSSAAGKARRGRPPRHPDALPTIRAEGEKSGVDAISSLERAGHTRMADQFVGEEWDDGDGHLGGILP